MALRGGVRCNPRAALRVTARSAVTSGQTVAQLANGYPAPTPPAEGPDSDSPSGWAIVSSPSSTLGENFFK
jgi:hypothetical protein